MKTIIRNTLAALVVAAAGVTASAPAANADSFGFGFSFGGPGGGVYFHDGGRHRGGWERPGHRRGFCKPNRAVRKARHMGVRRADVVRANHRRVVVAGFRHHRPVRVVFANQRRCPVIAVRHR